MTEPHATPPRLKTIAARLEMAAPLLAVLALVYRATLYWVLPGNGADDPGPAALLDFGLAMLLFLVCLACAAAGVAISIKGPPQDKRLAYRAFFSGVMSFLLYDLLHPYLPRLM